MADIQRMVPKVRREQATDFSSHTGTVYEIAHESEDKAKVIREIVSFTAVTTANFSTLKQGDRLWDLAASPIALYIKETDTDADSFASVTITT